MTADIRLYPIFPSPILVAEQIIGPELLADIRKHTKSMDLVPNENSPMTAHSDIHTESTFAGPEGFMELLLDAVGHFGKILYGEDLEWHVPAIWYNRITRGGSQHIHNHANSMVSGIIYLSDCSSGATTVFHKPIGGVDPIIRNDNIRVERNQYNSSQWSLSNSKAGDLLLFPSQMLHSVPVNAEAERETLAFNALPNRTSCNGYDLNFRGQ